MITRSTILIRCVNNDPDKLADVVDAIEKVLGLSPETFMVWTERDGGDVSIEIDFDGDANLGAYNDVLLSFLPFMVDNVETEFRFMEKDRYEVRDQNGDVLHSAENYSHAAVLFGDWARDADESNEGAGIYDNRTKTWSIRLRFEHED